VAATAPSKSRAEVDDPGSFLLRTVETVK